MIESIIDLAKNLDSKSQSFQEEAVSRLQSFSLDLPIDEFNDQLATWILKTKLPTQLNVFNNFGQPPVTIFNNEEFVIDLYFWMYSDTSIHTHAFNGAFKVLYGESKQDLFEIKGLKTYQDDVKLNDITVSESKILHQGDCQQIIRGDSFCHRVIHHASPTITLCIRTIHDKNTPQWHQFENGLSILKVELEEEVYKAIFFFEFLLSQNHQSASKFLNEIINKYPPSVIMNLFEEVLSGSIGLNDEATEVFHDNVLKKYRKKEWFKLYLKACEA